MRRRLRLANRTQLARLALLRNSVGVKRLPSKCQPRSANLTKLPELLQRVFDGLTLSIILHQKKSNWSDPIMISRRIFVEGAALLSATPILANLLLLPTGTRSRELLGAEPIPCQNTALASPANSILFKIDGWAWDNIGVERTQPVPADRGFEMSNDDQIVIRVTQSWRTGWR
jgi:hypothetical protein